MTPEAFADLQSRVTNVEIRLAENTQVTQSIKQDTSEMVEAWGSVKGGFKVLETIGKIAKPIGYILGVVTGMALSWTSLKATIARLL